MLCCCVFATHAWVGGQEAERKRAADAEAERKRSASKVCACVRVCVRARGLCLLGLHVYVCVKGRVGNEVCCVVFGVATVVVIRVGRFLGWVFVGVCFPLPPPARA